MVDIKGFNGGLNTDSALELLPSGDYTYALNISNGSEGIVNMLGNRPAGGFPANTNPGGEWICGAFFDKVRQRIIYFTNHERGNHRIISYEVPSISNVNGRYIVLFEDLNGIFGYWDTYSTLSPNGLIKDIKVVHREYEGDLYYFIDPKKKLLKFNYTTIQRWKSGDTTLCAFGWTDANYDGTTLRDGTPIPQVTSESAWAALTTPAWCYYNNDPANNSTHGKLYNWYAVSNPLFAPTGYRVPTKTDWDNLITCLGGTSVAGGKMKSEKLWNPPNTGATNEGLLDVIPGGARLNNGIFNNIGDFAYLWSATDSNANIAFNAFLSKTNANATVVENIKKSGFSVRLIKEI